MRREAILVLCAFVVGTGTGLNPAAGQRAEILGKLNVAKRTINVFGQQIAYYEAGRGKTVVLLPNLTWDSHAWSQNIAAMSEKYHVIAMDLSGAGEIHGDHVILLRHRGDV